MMDKDITPTEHDECVTLANYLEILKNQGKVICFTKTAQETWTRSWKQKRKNKVEGLNPGLPDYIIILDSPILDEYVTIFIEMKRVNGGVVSEHQKLWLSALKESANFCRICKGFNEAKKYIDSFLIQEKEENERTNYI